MQWWRVWRAKRPGTGRKWPVWRRCVFTSLQVSLLQQSNKKKGCRQPMRERRPRSHDHTRKLHYTCTCLGPATEATYMHKRSDTASPSPSLSLSLPSPSPSPSLPLPQLLTLGVGDRDTDSVVKQLTVLTRKQVEGDPAPSSPTTLSELLGVAVAMYSMAGDDCLHHATQEEELKVCWWVCPLHGTPCAD